MTDDDVGRLSVNVFATRLVVLSLVLLAPAGGAAETAVEWWHAEQVQRTLHLTPFQVSAIDRVYKDTLPARRTLRAELDRLEANLKELMDRPDVDQQEAATLIERVEAARARRNVARTMLLFHIRRILTAEQRQALKEMTGTPPADRRRGLPLLP